VVGVHYLETERLVLREFTEADVDKLVELDADPDVMFFVNGGRPTPREHVEQVLLPAWRSYYTQSPRGLA
jgi:RimJ/RimL family protein N-acetyltransferase